MQYILYAFKEGKWSAYAEFRDKRGYAESLKATLERRKNESGKEARQNAAIVIEPFVLGNYFYAEEHGGLVVRALRHFEEVGISNDVYDSLEELLDEGCEYFALAKEDEDIGTYTELVPNVTI